jgi:hypothetical protein
MLKNQMPVEFPCHVARLNSTEISHSEFDSDAVFAVSNVLQFKPRSIVASRKPIAARPTHSDNFFSTLAAAMTRKSVAAHMETF